MATIQAVAAEWMGEWIAEADEVTELRREDVPRGQAADTLRDAGLPADDETIDALIAACVEAHARLRAGVAVEDHGTLHDYRTGDSIRPATAMEAQASEAAAAHDGGSGVIEVDGRSCYVA